MQVSTTIDNNTILFRISGRIDTASAEDLRASLAVLNDFQPDKAVLNMDEVDYISSVGLRQILNVRKRFRTNEAVEIINCSSTVMEIFETTGFIDMMTVLPKSYEADKPSFIEKSFGEMLDYWASREPDRIFITEEKKYSYKMVETASRILALKYMKEGIRRGSHVGIYAANDIRWIVHFLALQYLGAVTLLINPALKMDELLLQAEIGDMTAICIGTVSSGITAEDLNVQIRNCRETTIQKVFDISGDISFDEKEYDFAKYAVTARAGFDDPAVIIFSSGSTGRPKGVLLSAYSIFVSGQRFNKGMDCSEKDRLCLVSPLFHVVGLNGVLGLAMIKGAEIVIPENKHIETIISVIEREKCTVLFTVPTILLAITGKNSLNPGRLDSLRSIIFGAAPMSESQIRKMMEIIPHCSFSTAYGLSELAPITISPYGDTEDHISRTVGNLSDGVELKIVNIQTGELCGPGEEGEILARGSNMMLGYYNLSIEDQSIDENDWLHSGDIGYLTEDGYLCLSGRIKEIIIRGGENIIPNEIAYAICSHENIIDAKVLGVKDNFYGETVAACIRLKDRSAWDKKEMDLFLSNKIAKYKIPCHYEIYDEFPLLSNGKIDGISLKKDLWAKMNISETEKSCQ